MQKFWVVILTLMGAGLRVYQLTERSLWTDESITLIRIQHSWGDILRNHVYLLDLQTIDTNPFAYFIGLKLWALGAGSSEFALKLFSAWLGVLMIPLTYALGRRLLGHRAALLAALFVLLSPGIEWYSHELRMYTLVGCMSALNGILVFNAIAAAPLSPPPIEGGQGGGIKWAAYILAFVSTLLSIATHYTFIGQAAAFWGLMGVALWQRRRRSATPAQGLTPKQRRLGLAIGLIIGLTALTLSTSSTFGNLVQRLVTGQENDYFFVPLHLMWNSVINGFVFGLNAGDPSGGVFAWLLCGVAALAFALPLNPPSYRGGARGVLIAGGLMPLLAWFGISFIKSNFQGLRHMFLLLPYVAVALAGVLSHYSASWPISHSSTSTKIQNLKSKIQNALILLTLIAQSYGLVGMFTPSEHWYDDWRGVAHYVGDHWLAGDVLVLNSQTVHGAIDLYTPGLTWEITPPVQNNTRDTVDEAKLRELSQRYKRLWFVHEKPNNQISAWLAQNTFFRQRTGFAARNTILQAELYDAKSPILPPTSSAWNRRNIAPQPNLPLQWMGDSISPNLNSPSPQPNVHVRLYLQRNSGPLPLDYAITYRLIGEDGSAWLNWDQPIDLSLAPAAWRGDHLYWVDMVLPLPVGLPILPYRLQVQARAGGQTLQTHEERLSLAAINNVFRVAPPPLPPPLYSPPYRGGAGGGQGEAEYPRHLKPGDYLPLALTWQLDAANKAGWTTTLHLSALLPPIVGGSSGEISVTKPLAAMGPFAADSPIQPDLPAQVGQAVRDLISLQVPPSAKAGWYGLWLTRQRDGQNIDWQWLGSVQVQDYAAAPLPPPSQVPINAKVGELTVLGYDVDRALAGLRGGDTLHFNTQWRVEGSPSRDGVLFLHILGPDGKLAAQHDSPPITAAGLRPTQTYRAGEGINQTHHLTLKPDAAAGEYRILLGVYDRSDGQRWPAQLNGAAAQDDLVELGRFVLK